MSSEESGQEGDEEVMVVKTLPWRSDQVNRLFKQLDDKTNVNRTPKARRQVIPRTFSGEPSSRPDQLMTRFQHGCSRTSMNVFLPIVVAPMTVHLLWSYRTSLCVIIPL